MGDGVGQLHRAVGDLHGGVDDGVDPLGGREGGVEGSGELLDAAHGLGQAQQRGHRGRQGRGGHAPGTHQARA